MKSSPRNKLTKELEQNIRDFIISLKDAEPLAAGLPKFSIFFSEYDEGTLFLGIEEATQYHKILNDLYKIFCKNDEASNKYVEKIFQRTILLTLDITEKRTDTSFEKRLAEAIDFLKSELTGPIKTFRVFYPVEGLGGDGLPVTIGNCQFIVYSESEIQEIVPADLYNNSIKMQENREVIIDKLHKHKLIGKTYAVIPIIAKDEDAARARALAELKKVIDILNFYSDVFTNLRTYIFIPGESNRENICVPTLLDDPKHLFIIHFGRTGPFIDYSIPTLLRADKKNNLGLSILLSSLDGNNKFREKIITSIRWAGRATVLSFLNRKEEAFLLYAIALESIVLSDSERQEIGYRLRVSLAHLLAKSNAHKPLVEKQIKHLYTIRSKIVHSGSYEILEDDLSQIRHIVKNTLVHLLRDEPFLHMTEVSDLDKWFENKIYGIDE